MPYTIAEREEMIRRYEEGPGKLKAALRKVPAEAMKWRPAEGKWSVHEVICHCADSETNGAARIRYLVAEEKPLLVGYDQDRWARKLDYHSVPLEPALEAVEAVRANTAALLRCLPGQAWEVSGAHTESGRYTAEDWLKTYAEHLEIHARQIERNLKAWENKTSRKT